MFLKRYPDGTIRNKKRHLKGHVYPSNRVSLKKCCHDAPSASALLNVSSDEESKEQNNAPL